MLINTCDLKSRTFDADFLESIKNTGFAVITNHRIAKETIISLQDKWREFFQLPLAEKQKFADLHDPGLGFFDMKSETAVGAQLADLKQFFHYKPLEAIPTSAKDLTHDVYANLRDLGMVLLNILDKDLNDKDMHLRAACLASDNTILRALYYPATDYSLEQGAVRAAEHEDINFLTLLVAASSAGLQVKALDGTWIDAPLEPGSIVCNVGDQLQMASAGRYKSTTHRVVNASDSTSDRLSFPLFLHAHSSIELQPGFTAGQYLAQRLAQIMKK